MSKNKDVRRVGKQHLSVYITLPKRFSEALEIKADDYVEVELTKEALIVKPLYRPGATKKEIKAND